MTVTSLRPLPVLAAILTGIQVGAALVASRYVIDQTSPSVLALLRYAIGFLCLLPAFLILSRQGFRIRDILPIGILGILQFGILVALLNYAIQYMPSAQVALIFSTFPLQTLVLAFLFGKEDITLRKVSAVLLTIIGVAATLLPDLVKGGENGIHLTAVISVVLSAFIGALCSIFYRPFLERYPAQNISLLAMAASVLALGLYSGFQGEFLTITDIRPDGWYAVLFIGISSGVGYFAWLWALKYMPPTRVTMFLSLGPISSAVLGGVFLSEPITFSLMAGIGLVVSGLYIGFSR